MLPTTPRRQPRSMCSSCSIPFSTTATRVSRGAKGREWQTVVVLGMEEDRFPNRRSLVEARDPDRALEEERRLAYVALTRATRRLVLAYDPRRPSRFLREVQLIP